MAFIRQKMIRHRFRFKKKIAGWLRGVARKLAPLPCPTFPEAEEDWGEIEGLLVGLTGTPPGNDGVTYGYLVKLRFVNPVVIKKGDQLRFADYFVSLGLYARKGRYRKEIKAKGYQRLRVLPIPLIEEER
jgi:hypothetical protein